MTAHHRGLVFAMVAMSTADGKLTEDEIEAIKRVLVGVPAFDGFDRKLFDTHITECLTMLVPEGGMDALLAEVAAGLGHTYRTLAYALACDIMFADGKATKEEEALLETLRDALEIPKLFASSLEFASLVRKIR